MIYFVAYTNHQLKAVTVIDLDNSVEHERDEWSLIDDEVFYNRDEAILHGRLEAKRLGVAYEEFESRYDDYVEPPIDPMEETRKVFLAFSVRVKAGQNIVDALAEALKEGDYVEMNDHSSLEVLLAIQDHKADKGL